MHAGVHGKAVCLKYCGILPVGLGGGGNHCGAKERTDKKAFDGYHNVVSFSVKSSLSRSERKSTDMGK